MHETATIWRFPPVIPRAEGFDSTLAFLAQGYAFVGNQCAALNSDIFKTRLMLRPVVCMQGEEAADMFYNGGGLRRKGAMPPHTLRLLQDKGSVQQLEDEKHRARKAMFTRLLLGEDAEQHACASLVRSWNEQARTWPGRTVVLQRELAQILARAAHDWAGIPSEHWSPRNAAVLSAMIENAGLPRWQTLQALIDRRAFEKRMRGLVSDVRTGALVPRPGSALEQISAHRDADGMLLSEATAAVELINILRPIVAVGRFIVFAALALHEHPKQRARLSGSPDAHYDAFAEEVRRLYPFFPVVGGTFKQDYNWKSYRFKRGDWVLLNLYGTTHDPRLFESPEKFWPERGLSWREESNAFIPQGGGDVHRTHRCPGERLTVALMREAIRQLVEHVNYSVLDQDLSISLKRIPAAPESGFLISVHAIDTPGTEHRPGSAHLSGVPDYPGQEEVAEMEGQFEELIRSRAYQIWESEGRPEGRAQDHWEMAERELGTGEGDDRGPGGPGINYSRGTSTEEIDALEGDNTLEGDVLNDPEPDGSLNPTRRGRTNP